MGLTRHYASLGRCAICAASLLLLSSANAVDLGEVPPDYLGKSNKGEQIYLSESNGRIRIVTFWATWCAPCLKELPVLNVIQNHAGEDRLKIIAVNLSEPRKQFRKALRAFADYSIDFVHDRRGTVSRRYAVEGIPHMLIIDADGRVVYQHVGYNESALEGIVEEINSQLIVLAERKSSHSSDGS